MEKNEKFKMKFKEIKKRLNDKLTFKIQINFWFIVIFILLPIIAYADKLLLENNFTHYLVICFLELILIFVGYLIGYNKRDKELKQIKIERR